MALKAAIDDALTLLWQIQNLHEHTLETLKNSPPAFSWLSPPVPKEYGHSHISWFKENLTATNDSKTLESLEVQSTMAISFAILEFGLSQLAREILLSKNVGLELRDIHENGIKRAMTVLRRIGGIDECFSTPEWRLVQECERLRNLVMHGGGLVEIGSDRQKELAKLSGVELRSFAKTTSLQLIAVSPGKLEEYFLAFRKVLLQVLNELETTNAHS